jgi:hypothetical protein
MIFDNLSCGLIPQLPSGDGSAPIAAADTPLASAAAVSRVKALCCYRWSSAQCAHSRLRIAIANLDMCQAKQQYNGNRASGAAS